MSRSRPASINVCQFGGTASPMYGCTALENPKMSMTSTSLAVSRVCVTVDSSWALTTARSIEMFGFASSNVALNSSRNSVIGGFWWTSTAQGHLLR